MDEKEKEKRTLSFIRQKYYESRVFDAKDALEANGFGVRKIWLDEGSCTRSIYLALDRNLSHYRNGWHYQDSIFFSGVEKALEGIPHFISFNGYEIAVEVW